jgi:SAM-dependent methyltransferase
MWDSVADSWAMHALFVDNRHRPASARMLQRVDPRPGDRVLELASGPGGLGLEAATLVVPDGEVVLSDVAPQMVAVEEARARSMRRDNVRAMVLDLEEIAQPDGSFEVVLCRDGLQFALDPHRAAAEIARVLHPGGRVAVAVWGPRHLNPWLGVLFDVLTAQLGMPVPPPGVPGPFSLGDGDRLDGVLRSAGLEAVRVVEQPLPLHVSSFDEWWAMTSALAGPLASVLSSLPDDVQHGLRAAAYEAVGPYMSMNGIDLPGVALIADGRKPR